MKTTRSDESIDEKAIVDAIYENSRGYNYYDKKEIEAELRARDKLKKTREQTAQNEDGTQIIPIAMPSQLVQSENKRKHRKASLEEFRQQFMHAPKIDDRKPIFISLAVRDNLDRIVRLFGERGLSVSGLMENLARHFLETYKDDVEQWRKM